MDWLSDNLLIFILIVQSLVTDVVLIAILINLNTIQKKRGKASYSNLKKIKGELKAKYRNSSLSYDLARDYKKKLIRLMEEQKLYRNASLKLADLASELGISVHHTSQIINQKFGLDFNTYINIYRITEAIRIFRCRSGTNIYDVLFEVGFNNKTTFNKAFKKYTDKTPSQFIAEDIAMMS